MSSWFCLASSCISLQSAALYRASSWMLAVGACICLSEAVKGWALVSPASMRERLFESTAFSFSGRGTKWLLATRSHSRRQLMMCKISTIVQRTLSLIEDLKQRKMMTTVGKHRWGASQSSSNAFVRDLRRMINR